MVKELLLCTCMTMMDGGRTIKHPNWHPDSHAIPGEGSVDWNVVKRALDDVDYKGTRLLEIESKTIELSETPEYFLKRAYKSLNKYL